MHYTSQDLFVGALENAPNCTLNDRDQSVWSKFMLMVLFQGSQHFVIDGVRFRIDAGSAKAPSPVVFMLNVAQPGRLRFIHDSTAPLHKVMISAPLPWLNRLMETQEGMPALRDFFTRHLSHFSFEPGQHILQLAEKIMHPPSLLTGELKSIYLKAQALDIMWQSCLALVTDKAGGWQAPTLMSLKQCERVRDYIVANLDKDLTIDRIAREAGASPSTIQRHFKEHFGVPVFVFIRQERLQAARAALATEGIPVSQAAHLAGYTNISSFTTAFRKSFGVTPKQARA
ncbi:helix-turn-helix domain-containing protein [Shinella zoogloeoides]|uniref:Helix-turn-helix domain-containing protein n=2 Tax=Shinella zoogloeoides TaxID=352475 RepID=A0A6N8TCY3_SHIZO|nr:helix-turn-helix domain-containing protein [Shinella zoogloeoides]